MAFYCHFPSPPSASQITASLRRDHDIIKKVLKATASCTQLLREGKEIPPAILLDTVDFITNFIDRCHHSKEEQGLFPALEATGMPRENSAIGTMLREHEEARKQIFHVHTRRKPLDSDINLDKLVEMTEGMTGADIAAIVNAAAMTAIKEHVRKDGGGKKLRISMKHLESALDKVKAGSSKSRTSGWQKNFPSSGSLT